MPRDKRLYMTYPIDIHRHPKVLRLPGEVKWTFVEMNGEARLAGNDGVFTAEDAEYLWPIEHLEALLKSHPTRPLLLRVDGTYVIREYAQHQPTVADIEAVAERARANGSKGGRPRKKNPPETQPVTGRLQTESHETQGKAESESESESKTLTDVNYLPETSPVGNVRARGLPIDELALQKAKAAGIADLAALHRTLSLIVGQLTPAAAVDLAMAIAKRSKDPLVRNVDAYVAKACRNSPADVRWDYDRLDLGAA